MKTRLLSIAKWIGQMWLSRSRRSLPSKRGLCLVLEHLEDRLAPATLSDGGTTSLSIVLGTNEALAIVSNGTSYTLSSNQNFTAASGADPANQAAAVSGVGTKSLTVTSAGFAQYATVNITDSGAGGAVTFNDSATNAYAHRFNITLSNSAAGAITFNGKSSFGAFNLQAATTRNIVFGSAANLSSSDGNLTLSANQQTTPTGGTFSGVSIGNATIQCTGAGSISVQGQAGTSGGNLGVDIETGGAITGGTGSVVVNGTGLKGVYVAGGTITSGGGSVQVTGKAQGGSGFGVWIAPNGLVTAGGTGSVTVQGTAVVSGTTNVQCGVYLNGGTITSNGGDVAVTGTATGSGSSQMDDGVFVDGGEISAGGAGNVTVQGTGALTTGGFCDGVQVARIGGPTATITSHGGNVLVTGTGGGAGTATQNYGINVGAGVIKAVGSGTVTVNGTAGVTSGGSNSGVNLTGSTTTTATVTSSGGNVQVTGTGDRGVAVLSLGIITAGGTGAVTVRGTGAATGGDGVFTQSSGTITSGGGSVQVIGQGGGSSTASANNGVNASTGKITVGGRGKLTIQGTGGVIAGAGVNTGGGTLSANSGGMQVTGVGNGGAAGITGSETVSSAGPVTLIADSMTLGMVVQAGAATVTLVPLTSGTRISLGGADAPGILGLTSAEIGSITAGTLQVGNANSGAITVISYPLPKAPMSVSLTSGSDIFLDPGVLYTQGGAVTFSPGPNGAVLPITNSIDAQTAGGAVSFAANSALAIAINGTIVDTQYNQLNVSGDVNLSGVNLRLTGSLSPVVGQKFTIVNNQGVNPIIGTFNSLPEGAVIANFLGSPLSATISYVGGTGNDVVLTVTSPVAQVAPTTTTVSTSAASSVYGQAVTFTATVSADSGTPTGSVEFFDDTTGADLGAGIRSTSSPNSATWILITRPTQLQVTPGPHVIRAVYSSNSSFIGSFGALPGGQTVTPLPLTVSGLTVIYNGTTHLPIGSTTGLRLSGTLSGDTVTLVAAGAAATFASKNVGTNLGATLSGLSLTGAQANDYAVSPSTTGSVAPAQLTISGITASDKVYDGTTAATLVTTGAVLNGVFAGDVVMPNATTATGSFASKNVGNNIPVAVAGITLAGADASNYNLTQPTTQANITPATVTVTGISAANKVYDGTTAATLNVGAVSLQGVVTGDTISASASGSFASKNVGTAVPVTLTALTLSGANAGNYRAALGPNPTLLANITPAPLTITGLVRDKVYDKTTAAQIDSANARVIGLVGSDNVTLTTTGAVGTFASANVGNGIPITLTNVGISGPQAQDYTLSTAMSANITPAPITVTGLSVLDKVYDGTTLALLNRENAVLIGVLAGDEVIPGIPGTGVFASKDVGVAIPVAVPGLFLAGAQVGNYVVKPPTISGAITPKGIGPDGITVQRKVYDGTTTATLNLAAARINGGNGESIALNTSGAAARFVSKDVGTRINVVVSGLILTGPDAFDFTLLQPTLLGSIDPAPVSAVGVKAYSKVYDGTTSATVDLSGASLLGVYSGDAVTLSAANASAQYASKSVGSNVSVKISGLTLAGAQASDYTLASSSAAWSQYGGNAAHTNAVPDTVTLPLQTPAWTVIASQLGASFFEPGVAMDGSNAYITANMGRTSADGYTPYSIYALNESNGSVNWQYARTAYGFSAPASGPSVLGGVVYAQFSGSTGLPGGNATQYPYLVGLRASTGQQLFASSYPAQSGYGNEPTVEGNAVFGVADYYGGFRGYDAQTGATLWDNTFGNNLPLGWVSNQIPAADNQFVYFYQSVVGPSTPNALYALDPNTGSLAFTIPNPQDYGYAYNQVHLGGQNDALVYALENQHVDLVSYDLLTRTVRWRTQVAAKGYDQFSPSGLTTGDFAVVGGKVYATTFGMISVFDEASGAPIGQTPLPADGVYFNNVLATENLLFASSGSTTYAFDRNTLAQVWSTNSAGTLSWANNSLFIMNTAQISAFPAASGITTTANITPAPLMVAGITAADKPFDYTTKATLNTTNAKLVGVVSGDTVTLNTAGATGAFTSAQVGNNVPVKITGLTISGAQARDYTLVQPTVTANITAQPPLASVNSISKLSGVKGLTPFTFQVKLSAGGSAKDPVTYDVFTTDGTAKAGVNYVGITAGDAAHGGTVTFAKGATVASVTVYVIAGSIPVTAGAKTFAVNLSDPLYPNVALSSGTGFIIPQYAPPPTPTPGALLQSFYGPSFVQPAVPTGAAAIGADKTSTAALDLVFASVSRQDTTPPSATEQLFALGI